MYLEDLNTNGSFLDQTALEQFRKIGCNPLIKISFDGIGHHDWLRNRKGAETDALRAIRLCVEKGFRVKVQTNVHRLNIESMLPTAEMLDEMGVDEMRMIRTSESPRWKENADGSCLEVEEYYESMLEFADRYVKKKHKMTIDIWQFLTVFPRTESYRLRPVEYVAGEYRDSMPVCRGNRGMVAVAADGNVYPCMQMSGYFSAKNNFLGNVKKEGLQPILQEGRYLSEVCATLGQLLENNETCAVCPYFKHCGVAAAHWHWRLRVINLALILQNVCFSKKVGTGKSRKRCGGGKMWRLWRANDGGEITARRCQMKNWNR